jgi:hypothetical protein
VATRHFDSALSVGKPSLTFSALEEWSRRGGGRSRKKVDIIGRT